MTDAEWQQCLRQMDEHEALICTFDPVAPDPSALRCVKSRHRTLGHLRACQESWLEVCLAFHGKPNSRVKILHPWRLFEQKSYEILPWQEHLAAFVADRVRWKELLAIADRQRAGKMNDKEQSIETLTSRLVAHEHYHLFEPR
jgi:hypothetical protein